MALVGPAWKFKSMTKASTTAYVMFFQLAQQAPSFGEMFLKNLADMTHN
jgi:hypothetical protein